MHFHIDILEIPASFHQEKKTQPKSGMSNRGLISMPQERRKLGVNALEITGIQTIASGVPVHSPAERKISVDI